MTLVISIIVGIGLHRVHRSRCYMKSMSEIPLIEGDRSSGKHHPVGVPRPGDDANWQFLQMIRARIAAIDTDQDEYDDRDPWDRR